MPLAFPGQDSLGARTSIAHFSLGPTGIAHPAPTRCDGNTDMDSFMTVILGGNCGRRRSANIEWLGPIKTARRQRK